MRNHLAPPLVKLQRNPCNLLAGGKPCHERCFCRGASVHSEIPLEGRIAGKDVRVEIPLARVDVRSHGLLVPGRVIVAKGGNFLLNIGPQADGELPREAVSRLEEIGAWVDVNGEAIHGTRPQPPWKEGRIVFTRREGTTYAILLAGEGQGKGEMEEAPPAQIAVRGISILPGSRVEMLGVPDPLSWRSEDGRTVIEVPEKVTRFPPCKHAWAVRITPPTKCSFISPHEDADC
jgi:hypothetical protein